MKYAILVLLSVSATFANAGDRRAHERNRLQQNRIEQGVGSGELTKPEARRLERGERHIKKMEKKAEADGQVTDKEKARIEKAQDVESKRIYREKHDDQKRGE